MAYGKGFQCHSNHSPQLLDLKTNKNNNNKKQKQQKTKQNKFYIVLFFS